MSNVMAASTMPDRGPESSAGKLSPRTAQDSHRAHSAAAFEPSTNCEIHLLRPFTAARYIASYSAGGKLCVEGRATIASA